MRPPGFPTYLPPRRPQGPSSPKAVRAFWSRTLAENICTLGIRAHRRESRGLALAAVDSVRRLSSGHRIHENRQRDERLPEALLLSEGSPGTTSGLLGRAT